MIVRKTTRTAPTAPRNARCFLLAIPYLHLVIRRIVKIKSSEAMINIAHPDHRDGLIAEAEKLGIYTMPMPVIADSETYYEGQNMDHEKLYGFMKEDKDGIEAILNQTIEDKELSNLNKMRIFNECKSALFDLNMKS